MKRATVSIAAGLLFGAASWWVVGLVSDRFEPYDNDTGLLIGQTLLSLVSFSIGYNAGFPYVAVYIISAYIGMNAYAYSFGGPGQRAWIVLGLIVSHLLVVIPFISGLLGMLAGLILRKMAKG